jgi:hypothetical protein
MTGADDGGERIGPPRLGALLAAPPPAAGRLWLTNARLFDGTGAPVRERAGVLVEDGTIVRVGDAGDGVPDGARIIDAGGRMLMPGLIDAHAHAYPHVPAPAPGAEPMWPGTGAHFLAADLRAALRAVDEAADELGRIDAVAGDGDHGRGMVRGSAAALEAARSALDAGGGPNAVLTAAGDAWAEKAGGTSGVLWGAALGAVGRRLGDAGTPDANTIAAAVRDGYDSLIRLGGAKPGDKTMLDALLPFTENLSAAVAAGEPLRAAWTRAAAESERAAQATAQLRPQVGRARPLAERSLGTPDAGAISMALCLRVVGGVLAAGSDGTDTRKDQVDG